MTIDEYQSAKRGVRLEVRLQEARELVTQAEDLLRSSEHLTFKDALALLERLRKDEPANDGIKQTCAERIAQRAAPLA